MFSNNMPNIFYFFQKYLTRPDTSDSGVDTGETDASSNSAEPVKFIDRLQESTIQTVLATQVNMMNNDNCVYIILKKL